MLGLPSALAGLVLGAVVAELLVPAVTLTVRASPPVPSVITQFAWAQALRLVRWPRTFTGSADRSWLCFHTRSCGE